MVLLSCRANGDPKFIWGPQGRNTLGVGMTLGLRLFLVPHLLLGSYYSFGAVRRKTLPPQVDQGCCLDVPGRLATLL